MNKTPKKYRSIYIYLVLVLATCFAFEQVRYNDFVWDDIQYITENPHVKCGITRESVVWAFSTTYASNWHPVTWLSHMLDYQLFGPNPLYHHLVNLLFHIANSLLLFWVLKRMTGAVWRSAFVATAFALHPIHVESVVWVAERKDLLCGFFWMLTIAAYIRYARCPRIGRYLLVILLFGLGLMAKPMIITLPFVLLLLDYWPLRRFRSPWQGISKVSPSPDSINICYQSSTPWRLIYEKIPLFILMVASAIITLIAQQKGGAMKMILPVDTRIANAVVSYIGYIAKIVYPSNLSVLYPHPRDSFLTWNPIASVIVLIFLTISIICLSWQKRHYLAVGWLWYLGALVPVIGLIQVGMQGMSDRYTYLPSIGFFIMVTWGAAELLDKWHYRSIGLTISVVIVLVVLPICTRAQVKYWRNNLTLFGHSLEATQNNPTMLYNLGVAFTLIGKLDEAAICYTEVLRLRPDYPGAHRSLGIVLTTQGKLDEAIEHFHQALQLETDLTGVRINLAFSLRLQGNFNKAIRQYREVLEVEPDHVLALNGIAWILATHPDPNHRDPNQAVEFAGRATELTNYKNATVLYTMAAAYAATGQFTRAVATAEKALELCQSPEQNVLKEEIENRLVLYKAGKPYIETQ